MKTFAFIAYLFMTDGTVVKEVQEDLSGLSANECAYLLTIEYQVPVIHKRGVVKSAIVACEEETGA